MIGIIEESSKLLFSSEGVLDFSLLQYFWSVAHFVWKPWHFEFRSYGGACYIPANLSYDTFVENDTWRIFQNHAHRFESPSFMQPVFFRFDLLSNGSSLQSLPGRKCGERFAAWNTNLEQMPLNICHQLPAPYKRLTYQWPSVVNQYRGRKKCKQLQLTLAF